MCALIADKEADDEIDSSNTFDTEQTSNSSHRNSFVKVFWKCWWDPRKSFCAWGDFRGMANLQPDDDGV